MPGPSEQHTHLTSGHHSGLKRPLGPLVDDYVRGFEKQLSELSVAEMLSGGAVRLAALLLITAVSRGRGLPKALALSLTAEQRVRLFSDIAGLLSEGAKGGIKQDDISVAHREQAGSYAARLLSDLLANKAGSKLLTATVGSKLTPAARSTTITMRPSGLGFVPSRRPSLGVSAAPLGLPVDPFGPPTRHIPEQHFGHRGLPGTPRGPLLNSLPHDDDERVAKSHYPYGRLRPAEEILYYGNKDSYDLAFLQPILREFSGERWWKDLPAGLNVSHYVERQNTLSLVYWFEVSHQQQLVSAIYCRPETLELQYNDATQSYPRHTMRAIDELGKSLPSKLVPATERVRQEVLIRVAQAGYAPLTPNQISKLAEYNQPIFEVGGGNGFNLKALKLHGVRVIGSVDNKRYSGGHRFQLKQLELDYTKDSRQLAEDVLRQPGLFFKEGLRVFGSKFEPSCLVFHLNCQEFEKVEEGDAGRAREAAKGILFLSAPPTRSDEPGGSLHSAVAAYSAAGGKRIAIAPFAAFSGNDWVKQMVTFFQKFNFSVAAVVPSTLPDAERSLFIFEKSRRR